MTHTQVYFPKNRRDARLRLQLSSLLILTFFLLLMSTTGTGHAAALRNAPGSFSEIAKKVSGEVVNIQVVTTTKVGGQGFQQFFSPWGENDPRNDFFERFFGPSTPREYKQNSLGSGIIVGKDGTIVTNNHVVENADEIKVLLKDGKEYEATIVGRDPNTDIAVIKIEPDETLTAAELGDSDALEVGEWVLALGSPFGYEQTLTAGIISAKGRTIGAGPYDDFLQTDASINPGNSGGPLINMDGEVIGINTAIAGVGTGIGFAIPINMAKNVIEQLKSHGEVTRGWLGVSIQSLTDELAEYYGAKDKKGALVAAVTPGDPADEAGVKAKDVIIRLNGKPVEDHRDLTRMVADIPVGNIAELVVLRNGKTKTIKVKVGKRDEEQISGRDGTGKSAPTQNSLGIQAEEITPDMAKRYNLPETEGVIVSKLTPDGKAAESGLQAGDIIKEINHEEITSMSDYNRVMNNVKEGDTISMFIRRASAGYLVVNIKP